MNRLENDYLAKVKRAAAYIEDNIQNPISLEDISYIAATSLFHFHKIFYLVTLETAGNYIRKRRLTAALDEVVNSDKKIIDIAFDYSYDSHEGFTRAFRAYFGASPHAIRKSKKVNPLLLKGPLDDISLDHIKSSLKIEPQFVHRGEMIMTGLMKYISLNDNRLTGYWDSFRQQIHLIKNTVPVRAAYNVFITEERGPLKKIDGDLQFPVLLAVEVTDRPVPPEGMTCYTIPEQDYLVFKHRGSLENILQTYSYIYFSYFKKSEYAMSMNSCFEHFDEKFDPLNPHNSEFSIFIPVLSEKKQ